jgi:hypothetical protein
LVEDFHGDEASGHGIFFLMPYGVTLGHRRFGEASCTYLQREGFTVKIVT